MRVLDVSTCFPGMRQLLLTTVPLRTKRTSNARLKREGLNVLLRSSAFGFRVITR